MSYNADGTRLFSCGSNKEGESFLVEWNESEGAMKRTYHGLGKRSVGVVQFDTTKNRFLAAGKTSNLGTANTPQDYNAYTSYANSSNPYGYGSSTGYSGYYNSYQQQQPKHAYSQPVRSITLPECRQNENTGTASNVSIANKPAECSNSPELPPRGLPPLVSALKASTEQNAASFHFPGHNRGHAAPASMTQLIGIRPYVHDLPELSELDNLFCPQGPILEAQKEAAKLFGSSHTWFLVGGTTCGIHAAIMATCSPGDYLILPRNCHWRHSVTGIESYQRTRTGRKKLGAVFITSPTYHGVCSNLAEISEICHSGKIPLIVDEAHGAHLGFHPKLPRSALQQGADLTV
ncbi:hypothetical protein KIW84_010746 [Lathyrus oleraceus]|uniref:Orn/Lys/Arg decarboxylases family 1 pyridoxal-P attachment site domain-containing protein n=1 Tax=Pisum sativum TaxID=3888 RepID=A0A9D4YKP2_PEA|nr:hypothetical protein KIW84_010746 [Pisum sativum]